jgi:cytochrome c oxidase accessory protein FixG
MAGDFTLQQLDERVLSTLNADGSRRWMEPRDARGRFWKARLLVAIALIAVFTALPWIRIAGKPPILLDVMTRQFTFFGTTFRPTETLLLALLMLAVFVAIFLLTALFGRVWCGWACPQTVYLEFVYRPLERLFLGSAYGRKGAKVAVWRRLAMYVAYLLLSAHLANTFLAYFVGTDRLTEWTFGSPAAHPAAFAVFAVTVGLMMFDFVFFREQLCTLVCPYGRFQSVLLDRDSLIIAYDRLRGEPRARAAERRALEAEGKPAGDCIECTMCQQVCPTGIDIRNGLQLECIHCAQCVDACDEVMRKVGKPIGLIRYSTQNSIERTGARGFRFRLVVYPVLLAALIGAFVVLLSHREQVLVEQVRSVGSNFTAVDGGMIESPVELLVENRTDVPRTVVIRSDADLEVVGPSASVEVPPAEAATLSLRVRAPAETFGRGSRHGTLRVDDGSGAARVVEVTVAGPFRLPPGTGTGGAR